MHTSKNALEVILDYMRRQRQAVVLVGLVPVDAKTPAARLRPEHFLRLERSCASDFFPLSPWLKPGEASTHFYYTHTRDHEVRPCFWRYVCRPRIAEDLALKTAHKGVISGVGKGIIGTWNSQSLFFFLSNTPPQREAGTPLA